MAHSTEVLRDTSLRLAAHAIELRRAAGVAQQRASNYKATAQALRTHGEACRTHAEAAHKRQDGR
jgi:hypothetical protein